MSGGPGGKDKDYCGANKPSPLREVNPHPYGPRIMSGVWPGLTAHQADIADGILKWLNYGSSPFALLTGVAGTGKTTLITALGQNLGGVAFAALTGKAASLALDGRPRRADAAQTFVLPARRGG